MRHVWPIGSPGTELDRAALAVLYAYPEPLARPFVRLNFVASADGAVSIDGVSGGLSYPGDGEVFGVLRELADVVLAGSGTVRTEGYRGVRTSPELRARRRARGQAEVPPVAVVTSSCAFEPDAPMLTDTSVPPLVLTDTTAPEQARRRLADAGAEVAVIADAHLGAPAILAALQARGLRRVLCEGGATLAGSLAAADVVDELCLSVSPRLAGAGAGRIVAGAPLAGPRDLRLASVIGHEHGLMLRYRTARGDGREDRAGPSAHRSNSR